MVINHVTPEKCKHGVSCLQIYTKLNGVPISHLSTTHNLVHICIVSICRTTSVCREAKLVGVVAMLMVLGTMHGKYDSRITGFVEQKVK